MNKPTPITHRTFALGLLVGLTIWSAADWAKGESPLINAGFGLVSGLLIAWQWRAIRKHNADKPGSKAAYVDTSAGYAVLCCSDCRRHVAFVETGDDLDGLAAKRAGHSCAAEAELTGGAA